MTTIASMSTTPLHTTPTRKQASCFTLDLNATSDACLSSWGTTELSVQYDHRGRLQPFVETSEQRRARVEFLRKREFSRRISAWLEDSSKSESSSSSERQSATETRASSSSDTDSLHTIEEDEETAQPEVIYSTSPPNSRWSSPASSPVATSRSQSRHLRSTSRTSSFSSLSSISEEEVQCI